MLSVTNRKLKGELNLEDADSTIEVSIDEACAPFGVLSFPDGTVRSVDLHGSDGLYAGRLILTAKEAKSAQHALFSVHLTGTGFSIRTNAVPVKASESLIKRAIEENKASQFLALKTELESLKALVGSMAKGYALRKIEFPKGTPIEPGMVPVAIDRDGTFAPSHPFAEMVREVNGAKSLNGSITIDASMIEYEKGVTVSGYLKALANAIDAEHALVLALKDRISDLSDQLNDLELRVSARLDGGSM